jgi:hypothetical protein
VFVDRQLVAAIGGQLVCLYGTVLAVNAAPKALHLRQQSGMENGVSSNARENGRKISPNGG